MLMVSVPQSKGKDCRLYKKQDPRDMAQVGEHHPCNQKALRSNPKVTKKKKKLIKKKRKATQDPTTFYL
jgi:hypothetical protein